eukprot:NODE_49_length_27162_cov_0.380039.p10 type:complete len:187 gc:universal NODE_49_length_27162_cov_0.380039:26177-26737(+)
MFITCIGDSLTQFGIRQNGWMSLLNSHFERVSQLISFGYSGYNTRWILRYLSEILTIPSKVFIVWLGTNDCCTTTSQFVEVIEYQNNISSILGKIKQYSPESTVILLSPIPTTRPERCLAIEYAEALYAFESAALLIDLFKYNWTPEDFTDGLHLSNSGNLKIFKILKDVLSVHSDQALPDWKNMD